MAVRRARTARLEQAPPVEAPKTTRPTPDARHEPVEDEWPFGDSEEWIDDGPRVDRPKTMRRASENPRDFIEDDWPVDEADDRIGDRPASPRRAPDAPPVSHSGERRHSPAAPASQRRPAPGLYPEGPDREPQGRYREPEPKRRRKPRPQQRSRREEPGFGDPPRRPAAEPERTTRPDRWSEPEADRRPGPPSGAGLGQEAAFSRIFADTDPGPVHRLCRDRDLVVCDRRTWPERGRTRHQRSQSARLGGNGELRRFTAPARPVRGGMDHRLHARRYHRCHGEQRRLGGAGRQWRPPGLEDSVAKPG